VGRLASGMGCWRSSWRSFVSLGYPTENVALVGDSEWRPLVRWSSHSVVALSGSHDRAYSQRSTSFGPHPDWAPLMSQIASTRAFRVKASRQRSVVSLPSGPVMA
jgi:hypothetical protein